MIPRRLLFASLVVSSLAACSGGSQGAKPDKASVGGSTADSSEQKSRSSSSAGAAKKLVLESASPRGVALIDFVDQKLTVGFSDGAIAVVDPGGEVMHAKVAKVHPVSAVAPTGDLALLNASPPVIVNFEGDLILQMNTVPSFESATFAPNALMLYVADKSGKVRIWGQPHSFEEDQHTEKLENYLNRQAPDFHVEFPPISGPIRVTDTNKLVVVDKEGTVRLWDPTAPSGSKRLMKVGGGARSISSAAGHILVTSTTGAFKIGREDGSGYLPWTKDATADFVVTSPLAIDTFYQLDTGTLRARTIETGDEIWSVEVPDKRACGLAISADAKLLGACIGNYVALFDTENGSAVGYGYRADGDFTWKPL